MSRQTWQQLQQWSCEEADKVDKAAAVTVEAEDEEAVMVPAVAVGAEDEEAVMVPAAATVEEAEDERAGESHNKTKRQDQWYRSSKQHQKSLNLGVGFSNLHSRVVI